MKLLGRGVGTENQRVVKIELASIIKYLKLILMTKFGNSIPRITIYTTFFDKHRLE